MREPFTALPPWVLDVLPTWVAGQRWYAGKGQTPALTHVGGLRLQDPAAEVEIDIHLLLDESGQTPTLYQVPLTSRTARLAGGDHALVVAFAGSGDATDDPRYVYDAPHDPVFAAALLRLMLEEGAATPRQTSGQDTRSNPQGSAETGSRCLAQGHRLARADPGQMVASRVLSGEQSNTSIILDRVDAHGAASKPLICKLFRVLHDGENPDVVVQSALAAAGSTRVPRSVGYVSGRWPDRLALGDDGMAAGHLAFAQEFLPGVEDAWRVALEAVTAGTDFSTQARSLGEATAQVHATLAGAMGTREATEDDVAALTASMRARHRAARDEVPDLAAFDSMVEASIEAVSSARWPALQRVHGDFHLGQVLNAPGSGWVLIDFEGEPLRPLAERSQPDLALRDVAGMLRSFDYAAGSWRQAHRTQAGQPAAGPAASQPPGLAPEDSDTEDSDPEDRDPEAWATSARTAFLEGYTSVAGRDPRQDGVLLDALELDKALYEVVYEARNRPSWLSIPTTAIARIADHQHQPHQHHQPRQPADEGVLRP